MNIGDKIMLKGRSKHGKNRVQQFGNEFIVSEIRGRLHTAKHQHLAGPFISVVSPTNHFRWVAVNDDPDFFVTGEK